jgi:uncharacterized membrane protein YoaK (UPF0700 family)
MNFEWARRRTGGIVAVAALSIVAGAACGSALGQSKSADSAAARM